MASFKLNIARIKGCPPPEKLTALMEKFGLPESEEYGVLNQSATAQAATATLVRKTQQAVQRLDAQSRELTSAPVEKVTVYPIAVRPGVEILEVYAGSAAAIEQVGLFFSGCLGLPTVVERIEIDIPAVIGKLARQTQRFQLRSIRVSDYSHNSYMTGPYAPKFLDSEHGKDFMQEYAAAIQSASVRFQGPAGRVNLTLHPEACFAFSCADDDQPAVQTILRKLL